MDPTGIMKSISEFGFTTVAMAAIIFAAWKLLNWGKSIVDNAMQQVETERARSAEVFFKLSAAIDEHTTQAKEFHMDVKNAHNYQRDEHSKIMTSCIAICDELRRAAEKMSYETTQRQKEHEKMIFNLEEQAKVLLRINGERH
jgi:uncharacterized coiled-coil DUF342 family protein